MNQSECGCEGLADEPRGQAKVQTLGQRNTPQKGLNTKDTKRSDGTARKKASGGWPVNHLVWSREYGGQTEDHPKSKEAERGDGDQEGCQG